MPEGPEIRLVAEFLHRQLAGSYIESITLYPSLKTNITTWKSMYVQQVISRGKTIIMWLSEDPQSSTCMLLESKLNMEGKWLKDPGSHTRAILHTVKYGTYEIRLDMYYDDTRNFGSLNIHYNMYDITRRIGFDLLEYAITNQHDLQQATNTLLPFYAQSINKHPKWDVTKWLMEQTYYSGIGNYLKAEVLYHSRLYPGRLLATLNNNEIYNMLYWSLYLILQSYQANGLTIRTYIPPGGGLGNFNTCVYGKQITPEGYPVIQATFQDKRTTHYCPTLQHI